MTVYYPVDVIKKSPKLRMDAGVKTVQENKLMKYMLLMYANESAQSQLTSEELREVQQTWFAYMQEAKAAGVLVANNGLAPVTSATTVRVRAGKTLTTDGPFAETHEQLAGFSLLECKDLDDAIGWAVRIPMARFGSIEIRPLWDQV